MTAARRRVWHRGGIAVATALIATLILPAPVSLSDPPLHRGYSGKEWERDYGVLTGNCNRQAVGAVLGGAPGGATGSRVGKRNTRQVATTIGGILGSVAVVNAGRDMDERDRACLGHTLELAGIERAVVWTNTDSDIAYRVIPLGGYAANGLSCREFVTRVSGRGHSETVRHKACSASDGVWQIVG